MDRLRADAGELRIAYFGPEGTFTHEALMDALAGRAQASQPVPFPTMLDRLMVV